MFKDLLFQVVVILVPVLLYYALFNPKGYQLTVAKNKIVVGIFSSVSIILCMSFPVYFESGTILDLRSVPWLLAFFYGGNLVGFLVTIVLIVFRFFLNLSTGSMIAFVTYSSSAVILLLFYKNTQTSLKNKMKKILLFGFFTTLLLVLKIYIFVYNFSTDSETLAFLIFFVVFNVFTLYLIVSLIEALEDRNRLYTRMQLKEKQYIAGQLAASVAHEIRNPMTVIQGFVQLIDQAKETPEAHRRYMKLMMIEIDRAESIIKEYLSLAKQEAGKLEVIDVNKALIQLEETLRSFALLHGVEIFISCTNEKKEVYGDKQKFNQVLINIVKNAIEASEGQGEISIFCSIDNENIGIEVKDYGKGMTDNQLKNIGTPFYSMKEKGTGLGLMVCYNIIEGMKGKIEVESQLNEGTSFIILLPKIVES